MSGLRIACLYGLRTVLNGYCIPADHRQSARKMIKFLSKEKISEKEIKTILEKFVAAYPFYLLIAQKNKIKNPFAEKVVKAYWIGNNLLKKAGGFKAHHSYHVYTVGSLGLKIKFTDQIKDICRVSWGRVEKIGRKLTVSYQPIKKKQGRYYLADLISREIEWPRKILPKISKGDLVSVHWNQVAEVISPEEAAVLKKYTQMTLNSL